LSVIPENKTMRLLFQPSEEDTPGDLSGADCMVKEGCLKDVDEVYGLHNCPLQFGKCFVKSGYVAAEFLNVRLKILGSGGHAGDPNIKGDPVQPGVDIYVMLRGLIQRELANKRYFCFSLPFFHAGTANNVIAEYAEIKGTFRSVDSEFTKAFTEEFTEKSRKICEDYGCKLEISIKLTCPAIINSEKEAENLKQIAIGFFGEENVGGDELFPVLGSDDFAFFSNEKPGVYFGIGIGRPEKQLHAPNFDFNDDAIDFISRFWLKIAEDRLGFKAINGLLKGNN
jgi:hippurate hydrolase